MAGSSQTANARGERVLAAARHLRSPRSGLVGEGARYVFAGGVVVVLYVAITTLLAEVAGLPFEVALAIGFGVALATQFTLYRTFVWSHDEGFALPAHHQAGRYLAVAGAGYGLSALAVATLPGALGVSSEAVYLGTVVALPIINFMISRNGIFHPSRTSHEAAQAPPHPEAPDRAGR